MSQNWRLNVSNFHVCCTYESCWREFNPLSKLRNKVHQRCYGIKTSLRNYEDFIRKASSTSIGSVDPFPTCITIDRDKFENLSEFCCLGNVIEQARSCIDTGTARIGSGWKGFHELLPILTNKGISLVNHGNVFKACVRNVGSIEVKPGPCLKDVTMQWFAGHAVLTKNRSTLLLI